MEKNNIQSFDYFEKTSMGYGLFTLAIFSSEKRAIFFSFRLVQVFSIVLFRLVIFQQFSQVRTKITRKQMGAVSIQASDFI